MKIRVTAALLALLAALTLSTAAFAGPFDDIPAGHWAYDAAAMLSAQGVMTGIDPGVFRGEKLITRYEMASAVARALDSTDKEKLSKEQLELLQKLFMELHDESQALGAKIENLDRRAATLEELLGGWRVTGSLQFDADFYASGENKYGKSRDFGFSRGQLNFTRRFGKDDFFYMRVDSRRKYDDVTKKRDDDYTPYVSKAYANFAMPGSWRMTVGRFAVDYETFNMVYSTGRFGEYAQGAWFTDINKDAIAFSKEAPWGYFGIYYYGSNPNVESDDSRGVSALASLQIGEKLALDFGADIRDVDEPAATLGHVNTYWVAPKYDVTPDISLRGAYFMQSTSYGADTAPEPSTSPKAWRAILDIKQRLLKYTSLWLEYDQFDRNFVILTGADSLLLSDRDYRDFFNSSNLGGDLKIWRVGLNQVWNDRLATWLYYASYRFSDYPVRTNDGLSYIEPELDEISAGVEYKMTNNLAFSLAYFYHKFNEDAGMDKERIIRFRTTVWF